MLALCLASTCSNACRFYVRLGLNRTLVASTLCCAAGRLTLSPPALLLLLLLLLQSLAT